MLLRKRAEEITELVKKAEEEISSSDDMLAGNITVGAGETDGNRFLIKAMNALRQDYPFVHFHIISGDKATTTEAIDRGLIDFGLIFGNVDLTKYDSMPIPYKDKTIQICHAPRKKDAVDGDFNPGRLRHY